MGILSLKIQPLPGIPVGSVLAELADVMVGPFLQFDPRVDEGPRLNVETGVAPLVEHLATWPEYSSVGRSKYEGSFSWNQFLRPNLPIATGSVTAFVDASAIEVDDVVQSMLKAMQVLQAPFGYVDLDADQFRGRDNSHIQLFQEGKTGSDRIVGLSRGLSGVPWRTAYGPALVDFFGVENLRSLPSELANEIADGFWLLSPCEQYEDWDPDHWCPGEEQIIETLGREKFFDPATGALPTVYASLPPVASIPVKTKQPGSDGVWEFHNGYPPE